MIVSSVKDLIRTTSTMGPEYQDQCDDLCQTLQMTVSLLTLRFCMSRACIFITISHKIKNCSAGIVKILFVQLYYSTN